MDDDGDFMNDGSELQIMERDWKRRSESRYNEGFVEGSLAGQKQSLQTAFNAGFKQGFLSCFLLGKIAGILNAVIAYQVNYEGHPITDSTILEAHSLLEEIKSLQTDSIAEDFIRLSLDHSKPDDTLPNDIVNNLSSLLKEEDMVNSTENLEVEEASAINTDFISVNSLTVQRVNDILLQCPSIKSTVDKCKHILKCLKWSDDVIDQLL